MNVPIETLVGHWVAIFITIAILSYLYADNPFYKLAEHVFVGVSLGYAVVTVYFEQLKPNLIDRLMSPGLGMARFIYLVPLVLVVFLFLRLTKRYSWLGRLPIAFVIGIYAGQNVPAYANTNLVAQLQSTVGAVADLGRQAHTSGWDLFGVIVLVVGMVAGLVYFFFSIEHKGVVGYVARTGVWVLMIGFGASFGYTVQGRLSLAIGRAMDLLGSTQSAAEAAQYHSKLVSAACVLVIFGAVIFMERRRLRNEQGNPPGPPAPPPQMTAAAGSDEPPPGDDAKKS